MKINRKNLLEAIEGVVDESMFAKLKTVAKEKSCSAAEAVLGSLEESDDSQESFFETLMDLAADENEGSGVMALELKLSMEQDPSFNLTEKQIRTLYNVVLYNALEHNIDDLPEVLKMRPPEYSDQEMQVHHDMAYNAIAKKSETPERLLKQMGFDFHNEFTQVYGVTPPRDKEFNFDPAELPWKQNGEDIYLTIPTQGGGLIVFTFTFEGELEDHPSDPNIYLRNKDGDEIWMDIAVGGRLRYDTEQGEVDMSKEEVPRLIHQHMGDLPEWPELSTGPNVSISEAYSSVSDTYQRGEIDRWIRKARSISSPLHSELAKLKKKLEYGNFDDNRDWNRAKEIGKELEQKQQVPSKQEPTTKKYVKPAPCLSAKEEWAKMLITLEGDISKNWLDRVLTTTRDEIALFGWGWILKKATQAAGGAFGWQYGGPAGALIVQELIDFAWNAAPRIIEDMAFRPQKAWSKPNVIEMFPILDQFDLDEAIYNMISPDAIGIIAKSYAEEVNEFILSNPDACMDEIPEINDYYTDWLRANPEMMRIMSRKTSGRKYTRPFRLTKESLFDVINEVLRENEEESPIDLLKNKIENIIPQKDWGYYVQFFDLIDTFDESGLIEREEANALRERLWGATFFMKVYDAENLDEIAELFLTHKTLPKDTKGDIHQSIHYYGGFLKDEEWALKYVAKALGLNLKIETIEPENLYEISGADGDTLDKFKEHLIELGEEERFFEVYPEHGSLMFGVLAQPYVNFEKKIEEIFGATPVGDPSMYGGSFLTVSIKNSIDEPFESPMVKGAKVTADVMFEWNPDTEYGMEITLVPVEGGEGLQDYYGIWVSTAQDGPNIGKLQIGIQNYEDEFADHKLIQNKNGTYGFTIDEMKNKIKEMTGVDLNEIN